MSTFKTQFVILLISVLFVSCKKDKVAPVTKDMLTGSWEEVPQKAYSRRLLFEAGGKFTMQIRNNTNTDWDLILNGKYSISGADLSVIITEQLEKQASGQLVKTAVNKFSLFDKGKFNIQNFVLTINYKSYPADAPVDTEAKFNKLIPID